MSITVTRHAAVPFFLRAALLSLLFVSASCSDRGPSLTADFAGPKTEVSGNLFGIFLEDINYAFDGGLYGEMVQNRSFEFRVSKKSPTYCWNNRNLSLPASQSTLKAAGDSPLNGRNPTYARLEVRQAGDGVVNPGYKGMSLRKGKVYRGSAYFRSPDASIGSVTVTLGPAGGDRAFARVEGISREWRRFAFDLACVGDSGKGELGIFADGVGVLEMDFVSLFRPDDEIWRGEENGLRKDLVQRLFDLHPAFVRFPGGCIVQGTLMADRYQWKETLGPVEERKENANFWGYQQSYGIGFYELFRLCEDIGAEPVPILNAGISYRGESGTDYDAPLDGMQAFIDDALDLIEWAQGGEDSEWGAKRAAAGHREPFALHYLGIGNEDGGPHYYERYRIIADAVKERYPDIRLILSAGAFPADKTFYGAWEQARAWESEDPGAAALVDEHYYQEDRWFLENTGRYADASFYPRGQGRTKVFVGEYASWVKNRRNNLRSALTEAAYMTALERDGDVVELASYAPLFAHDTMTQWTPDLIWFDNAGSYGTPNYYVQQLFMTHRSDRTVRSRLEAAEGLYAHVGEAGGRVVIKLVNVSEDDVDLAIRLKGAKLAKEGRVVVVGGASEDENSFADPEKVFPREAALADAGSRFRYTVPACSLCVLELAEM